MDLIGIDNEAEFFPSGTLSDVLKEELQDITARWAGLDRTAHPVERLARVAGPTVEALRQVTALARAGPARCGRSTDRAGGLPEARGQPYLIEQREL